MLPPLNSRKRKAIVTVGMGFGDEGKGATVDFLTRKTGAELVVRYSGGAQAGHNVELENGQRHTFAQFGSGTFAGAATYLGPRMIICPATLVPEAEHLDRLGVSNPMSLLSVHPECLLTTSSLMLMNRMRETARGARRHGSCGLGIGEARSYWLRHGGDAITAKDVLDHPALISKLTLLRDRMLIEMQNLIRIDSALATELYETRPEQEADRIRSEMGCVDQLSELPGTEVVIFEGAQGVLLDEYFGFHPHTTWSTVTPYHADEIITSAGFDEVVTLGITRAYSTRHGAGPFPTRSAELTARINDSGNPANDWQGAIESGPLDLMLLDYAAGACAIDGMVVNNLDELPPTPAVCRRYNVATKIDLPVSMQQQREITSLLEKATPVIEPATTDEILDAIEQIAPVAIIGSGPSASSRCLTGARLPFKERAEAA